MRPYRTGFWFSTDLAILRFALLQIAELRDIRRKYTLGRLLWEFPLKVLFRGEKAK
jgi:hypothetical protein